MSYQHGAQRPRKHDTGDMLYIYIYINTAAVDEKHKSGGEIHLPITTKAFKVEACLQAFTCTKNLSLPSPFANNDKI